MITDAKKLFMASKTSISFKKGTPESYYVVSGIVKDDQRYEAKIVYKKRLEASASGPLSSVCSCSHWNQVEHCSHVACLFIYYNVQLLTEQNHQLALESGDSPPLPSLGGVGVTVDSYGTIIKGPTSLLGAGPSSCYSSLQYILHSKKIVNFPIPRTFVGKILISVTSAGEFPPKVKFRYQDQKGEITDQINLFENLYLFNWQNGHAFYLPRKLSELVKKFMNFSELQVETILQEVLFRNLENNLQIIIDDKPLSQINTLSPSFRVTLSPSEKKGHFFFSMVFFDNQNNLVRPPVFLRSMAYRGGLLDTFKKKSDVATFISRAYRHLKDPKIPYKETLARCSDKGVWIKNISYLNTLPHTFIYGTLSKNLYVFDTELIKGLFAALYESFSEQLFRLSMYDDQTRAIVYTAPLSKLMQGLNKFYQKILPLGGSIFYNKHEIRTWKSRIRFERNSRETNWFDLQINVPNEDLQVIKNLDPENNVALTSKGPVFLGDDQKDLAVFLKKFMDSDNKIHSSESDADQDGETINKFIAPFHRSRIFELFELKNMGLDGALTEDELKICQQLKQLKEIPQYPLSKNMSKTLRPYQVTGHNWLRFLYENKMGACLADDMGLGKTLQTISFIESIHDRIRRVLIACPVSLLLNWEKEFIKFSNLETYIYYGGARNFPENVKIILTSFGIMKKECETIFKNEHFDVFIMDEVQHLKNIRSLGSIAARKIKANFRICMTGTPVENDLSEFYNILDLSIPGIWGNLQYTRTISNLKTRIMARKTARPFILRRTKDQVLTELPPKVETTHLLDFTEKERENYQHSLVQIRHRLSAASPRSKYGEVLRGLLILRQHCLWNRTDDFDTEDNSFTNLHLVKHGINSIISSKIRFLMDTLEQILAEGHQVIVFSQFTTYLNIIQAILKHKEWSMARIDGTQSIKKRQDQVALFQNNQAQVFLISLKAGGVGLNLTAASYVFIMDPWWNPAVENQAIDRAHRIGQQKNLNVYRIIVKNSIEENIIKLQEAKRELFYDLLPKDDDSYFTGKLTMKDFEELLK